jgi:hypothetical protein
VGQVTAGAMTVRGVHGDVDAGVADHLPRAGEAPAVAQLGPHRHRGQPADTEMVGDQGLTSGLAGAEAGQLGPQGKGVGVGGVDHGVAHLEPPPGRRADRQSRIGQ